MISIVLLHRFQRIPNKNKTNTMKNKILPVIGMLAFAGCLSSASAQTIVNFNGGVATDWTSQFNMAGSAFGWNATQGVGGSGAFTSNGNAGGTFKTGLSATGNNTFSNSVTLKSTGASSGSGSNAAFLGFGDTATGQIVTAAAGTFLFGVRLQSTSNANELTWQFRLSNNGSVTDGTAPITSITNGSGATYSGGNFTATNTTNWFQLSTTFTKSVTPNVWNFTASYQDFGATGTTAGAVLSSISGTFTQNSTYGASSLFASMGARNNFGNVQYSAVDNLTIAAVPEPATWALLALSLTTVMALRRRRNS